MSDIEEDNMNAKKVFNDVVDEEIELDTPEDIPNHPQALKNQPVDEVHHVSDDSAEMHVPSPEDSEHSNLLFLIFRCSVGEYD